MKRQRGRGRKPGGGGGGGGNHNHNNHHPNRSLESSGPEGAKVRGPAAHIYERYLQNARDASSSGDRVMAENYLQHAEHYFRVLRALQPAMPPPQQQSDRFGSESEFDGDEEGAEGEVVAAEGEGVGEGQPAQAQGDQPDVDFPGEQRQPGGDFNNRDDGFRRRRGRRNRFRPGEGGGDREVYENRNDQPRGESAERGERPERQTGERPERAQSERPERPQGEGRRERPQRERSGEGGGEQSGPEGFSHGPKPAFLGSD
ncbi:MAG: DUF4167 domain-containing protein [Alphaproteobacteria bacterium]